MTLVLVTNLSYTVFLITSLSTTFFSLLKSAGTVFSLSISILSDLAAKLDVSTPDAPLKSAIAI